MYKSFKRKTVEASILNAAIWDQAKGREIGGVEAECLRCGKKTESYGNGPKSIMRCLILLNKGCDKGEDNFYKQKEETMTCKYCGYEGMHEHWIGGTACPECGADTVPF